jgi:hypothetical protein
VDKPARERAGKKTGLKNIIAAHAENISSCSINMQPATKI